MKWPSLIAKFLLMCKQSFIRLVPSSIGNNRTWSGQPTTTTSLNFFSPKIKICFWVTFMAEDSLLWCGQTVSSVLFFSICMSSKLWLVGIRLNNQISSYSYMTQIHFNLVYRLYCILQLNLTLCRIRNQACLCLHV